MIRNKNVDYTEMGKGCRKGEKERGVKITKMHDIYMHQFPDKNGITMHCKHVIKILIIKYLENKRLKGCVIN